VAVEYGLSQMPIAEGKRLVAAAHRSLCDLDRTIAMTTALSLVEDEWRIFRSDGTDVHFNTPRSALSHSMTLKGHGRTVTVGEAQSDRDYRILMDNQTWASYRRRCESKLALGRALLSAPLLPAGSYNLIIDAGMAKGLAHEAFGHASES